MSKSVPVGSKTLGPDNPCYLIAEIGVNHNGDIDIAKRLISIAAGAGCDAVKFQKRTPELCVPAAQRSVMRETPWGYISYMDYRDKVEFGKQEYDEIDRFCKDQKIAGVDAASGVCIPQFDKLCAAFGLRYLSIETPSQLADLLPTLGENDPPVLIDMHIDQFEYRGPAVKTLMDKNGKPSSTPLAEITW